MNAEEPRMVRSRLLWALVIAAFVAAGAATWLLAGHAGPAANMSRDVPLPHCSARDRECLRNYYSALTYDKGPEAALASVRRFIAARHLRNDNCHMLLHDMGHAAIARDPGAGVRLVGMTDLCAYGFAHGVIEHSFHGVGASGIAGRTSVLCAAYPHAWDKRMPCGHAVGHALMHYTANDLPRALHLCTVLGGAAMQQACFTGVHMVAATQAPQWVRAGAPLYPCTAVARSLQYSCYWYAASRSLNADHSYAHARAVCDGAPAWGREECFAGMGRRLAIDMHVDVARIAATCATMGAFAGTCTINAASTAVLLQRDARAAAQVCASAAGATRMRCARAIGTSLWEDESPRPIIARACTAVGVALPGGDTACLAANARA